MDPKLTTEFAAEQVAARSLPASLQPCLVEVSGDMPGRTYCLTSPVYLFGRDDSAAIQVELEGVSRRHCEFLLAANGYEVHDLGSTNGTYVNGAKVERHSLVEGDRIAMGPNAVYTFRLYQVDEGEALSQMSEGVTKDLSTGALRRDHLVEWLQGQIALGREQRFEIALFTIGMEAPEGQDQEELAQRFHEALKANSKASAQVGRLGPLVFGLALPFTRDPEIHTSWAPLSKQLAEIGQFGAGVATTRDTREATPEKLIREALRKLRLAHFDIPNSLVR